MIESFSLFPFTNFKNGKLVVVTYKDSKLVVVTFKNGKLVVVTYSLIY